MSCELMSAELDAYLDGELDAGRAAEMASHLAGCAACSKQLAERRAVAQAVQRLPRIAAPAGFLDKFRSARIKEAAGISDSSVEPGVIPAPAAANSRRRLARVGWLAGSAAAAAAALFLTVTFYDSNRRSEFAPDTGAPAKAAAEAPKAPPCYVQDMEEQSDARRGNGGETGRKLKDTDAYSGVPAAGEMSAEVDKTTPGTKADHADEGKDAGVRWTASAKTEPRNSAPVAVYPVAPSAAPAVPPAPIRAPEIRLHRGEEAERTLDKSAKLTEGLGRGQGEAGVAGGAGAGRNEQDDIADREKAFAEKLRKSANALADAKGDLAGGYEVRAGDTEQAARRMVRIAESLGGREIAAADRELKDGVADSAMSGGAMAAPARPAPPSNGAIASNKPASEATQTGALEAVALRQSPRTITVAVPASRVEAFRTALALWSESHKRALAEDGKSDNPKAEAAKEANGGVMLRLAAAESKKKAGTAHESLHFSGKPAEADGAQEEMVFLTITISPGALK